MDRKSCFKKRLSNAMQHQMSYILQANRLFSYVFRSHGDASPIGFDPFVDIHWGCPRSISLGTADSMDLGDDSEMYSLAEGNDSV